MVSNRKVLSMSTTTRLFALGFVLTLSAFWASSAPAAEAPRAMPIRDKDTLKMPDPFPEGWVRYHLAHPGLGLGEPADPNAAIHHKGKYHFHYLYRNRGFAWAHVSSDDMVHWQWHPTVLKRANTGHGVGSGRAIHALDGRVAIAYLGTNAKKNQIAFAVDDNLDSWTRPRAIIPVDEKGHPVNLTHWDPDIWVMGDTYYCLFGGKNPPISTSKDLKKWTFAGPLFHKDFPKDLDTTPQEDVSCANMFKIGDRWMLLCISHDRGARYFLGDFKDGKYLPTHHALMNWARLDLFAPESLLAPDGRRVMWGWCTLRETGKVKVEGYDFTPIKKNQPEGIMSLPRELSLAADGTVEFRPLRELAKLRTDPKSEKDITVKKDSTYKLKDIAGDCIELEVTFTAPTAAEFGVNVLSGPEGKGAFKIASDPAANLLTVDYTRAPFTLKKGEDLTLRIFIDKCIVEVFANNRQAVVAWHVNDPEETSISLFANGGDVKVKEVKAWTMKSIYNK